MAIVAPEPTEETHRVTLHYTRLFRISPTEADFARRGFAPCEPSRQRRLEDIGRTFIGGYLTALDQDEPDRLGQALDQVEAERRGFAYEGAAMALALLDQLTPWRRDRFARFVAGPGRAHAYMVHVGAGWAMARLGQRVNGVGPGANRGWGADPLLRWLTLDGYGFHQGYFDGRRTIAERRESSRLSGYARRVFDQGLGRSLWFVTGADARRVVETIAGFAPDRRADLWSGVGLAAAYAGGLDRAGLESLRAACRGYLPHAAQGAAFAAKARARAGNPTEHTELACAVLCGTSAEQAARVTDEALARTEPADAGGEIGYEAWRRRVREAFPAEA